MEGDVRNVVQPRSGGPLWSGKPGHKSGREKGHKMSTCAYRR